MKKIIISLLALVVLTTAAHAQYNSTFGVRLGSGSAFGAELSYQKFLSTNTRIEYDLGASFGEHSAGTATAIYHWHWFLTDKFGFFAGPGAQLHIAEHQAIGLGIGGQIGIDYQFDFPIQLSLDIRPMWNLFSNAGLHYGGALGIRYAF